MGLGPSALGWAVGWASGLALPALLLTAAPAQAGQLFVPSGKDTLRALPGVEVIVEGVPAELQRSGLTQISIKADVTRALEAGGVRVYASQAANPSPAKAYLDLRLTALGGAQPRNGGAPADYAVAVQLHVRQTLASVVTESKVVNAATWDAGTLVSLAASDLLRLRDEIQALVNEFVEDWKAVH